LQRPIFQTLFLGQSFYYLKTVPSTNKHLHELLAQNDRLLEGILVLAGHQSAGRGQYGNQWFVEPSKNLTFSFLLKPNMVKMHQHFYLNKVISLGLLEGVKESLMSCADFDPEKLKVKWPNDLMYEDKKWAGILIENAIRGNAINHSIVGIGLNVNQRKFDENQGRGGSPGAAFDQNFDLVSLLQKVVTQLEKHYLALRSGNLLFIDKSYISNLYQFEKTENYRIKDEIIEGKIVAVEPTGHLIVASPSKSYRCDFKEIEFLKKP
jgi:BirA family biotin operon repressor/biotin-[acetyl-CoA-carboxylase] ligase